MKKMLSKQIFLRNFLVQKDQHPLTAVLMLSVKSSQHFFQEKRFLRKIKIIDIHCKLLCTLKWCYRTESFTWANEICNLNPFK